MKSSGIVRARRRPTAPHPEKEEGSRRLAGGVRHEGGRLRADRGPGSRSGRERRGGGWIFRALGVSAGGGLLPTVFVAFVGGVIVIVAQRKLWRTTRLAM